MVERESPLGASYKPGRHGNVANAATATVAVGSGVLSQGQRRGFLGLFAALIMLGLASLPLQFIVEDRRAVLNALEWWYALLMVGTYALMGRVWQRQGWRLQLLH